MISHIAFHFLAPNTSWSHIPKTPCGIKFLGCFHEQIIILLISIPKSETSLRIISSYSVSLSIVDEVRGSLIYTWGIKLMAGIGYYHKETLYFGLRNYVPEQICPFTSILFLQISITEIYLL